MHMQPADFGTATQDQPIKRRRGRPPKQQPPAPPVDEPTQQTDQGADNSTAPPVKSIAETVEERIERVAAGLPVPELDGKPILTYGQVMVGGAYEGGNRDGTFTRRVSDIEEDGSYIHIHHVDPLIVKRLLTRTGRATREEQERELPDYIKGIVNRALAAEVF